MRSAPARQIKISNKETHRVSETAGNEHRSQPTLHMSLSSHECLGSDLKETPVLIYSSASGAFAGANFEGCKISTDDQTPH
jgi:hypothetical protein